MYSQNLTTTIHLLASISFLALFSSLIYMGAVLLINYFLARMSVSVRSAGIVLGSLTFLLLVISGGTWGIIALVFALSWTFYWGWKFRLPYEKLFFVNVTIVVFFFGISVLSPMLIWKLDSAALLKMIEQNLSKNLANLKHLGVQSATDLVLLKKKIVQTFQVAKILYPFLIFFFSMIVSIFLMPVIQYFWKKYQGAVLQKSLFSNVRIPEKLIFVFIFFLALGIFSMSKYSPVMTFIGWNGALIIALLYAVQGGSVAFFFIKKWQKERMLTPIVFILLLFLGSYAIVLAFMLLAILGLGDFWLDFRKVEINPTKDI